MKTMLLSPNYALLAEAPRTQKFHARSVHHNTALAGNDFPAREFRESNPKTILVPLSLTSDPEPVLDLARKMARKAESRLVLLHVVQLNIAGEEFGIPRTKLAHELCQNAELQLQNIAESLGGNATAEVVVCEGRPAEVIIETAQRLPADLILMQTRDRKGWQKWFHPNTAQTVMRRANCLTGLITASNTPMRITNWFRHGQNFTAGEQKAI